jgi:RNA polymerase sigma-70 factor (ECF subfamily)
MDFNDNKDDNKGDKKDETISAEELYRRFISGDEDAFESLIALYERELTLFLNSFVCDSYEARHLMIESFAQLAISKGQFAGRSSLKTYLFTIGKNLALRHIKMRRNEQHISYDEIDMIISANSGDAPDILLEREETKKQLHNSMKTLKEEYRIILELLYWHDMSYREAGKIMGKSEKQVTNLAHRAKNALKKNLKVIGFIHNE